MKGDLAVVTVASQGSKSGRQFTRDELRQLFTLSLSTASGCETRDLLASASSSTAPQDGALQPAATGILSWLDVESLADSTTALAAAHPGSVTADAQQGRFGAPQGAADALQGMAQGKTVTAISVEQQQQGAPVAAQGGADGSGVTVSSRAQDESEELEISNDQCQGAQVREGSRKRRRAVSDSGSDTE